MTVLASLWTFKVTAGGENRITINKNYAVVFLYTSVVLTENHFVNQIFNICLLKEICQLLFFQHQCFLVVRTVTFVIRWSLFRTEQKYASVVLACS